MNRPESFFIIATDELLLQLFQFLDFISLCRISQVCQKFRNVAFDNLLWIDIAKSVYPHSHKKFHPKSWYQLFKKRKTVALSYSKTNPDNPKVAPIENCEIAECPALWENLKSNNRSNNNRICHSCERTVHFCYSQSDLDKHKNEPILICVDFFRQWTCLVCTMVNINTTSCDVCGWKLRME